MNYMQYDAGFGNVSGERNGEVGKLFGGAVEGWEW
jgi:hypothetical protein